MMNSPRGKKPLFRGHIHQEAFFITLGAGILLIAKSTQYLTFISSLVYVLGLLLLFGISATYHRPYWDEKPRTIMKRLDHASIFVFIASTFTPICLLALPETDGKKLLIIIWTTAIVGALKSFFWVKAPRYLTAFLYVAMGWMALPYLKELSVTLGYQNVILLFVGGVVYTVGAVFYALKRPQLSKLTFGYHELFHLLTVIAATFHFVVIYKLIQ